MATMEMPEVETGTGLMDMSAENELAGLMGDETNVVTQVQHSSTNNSGNTSNTVIQGYRPSRAGDFLASAFHSFAR